MQQIALKHFALHVTQTVSIVAIFVKVARKIHTCFLHLLHGSMYIASHIFSTVLESAIVLGKGSDCIHKPNTRRVRRQRQQAGVKTACTFMLHSATTDTLEHMLV